MNSSLIDFFSSLLFLRIILSYVHQASFSFWLSFSTHFACDILQVFDVLSVVSLVHVRCRKWLFARICARGWLLFWSYSWLKLCWNFSVYCSCTWLIRGYFILVFHTWLLISWVLYVSYRNESNLINTVWVPLHAWGV